MIISEKTWPIIESKINKLLNEEKKTKQQESEILGQKPVNHKGRNEKNVNKRN